MRYFGGKHRLAKRIATILEAHRSPGQRFVDVFCGGLSITASMGDHGPRVANDGCAPLIRLYNAWREGWRPPAEVSEELWRELKSKQDPNDPLTAFAGFGCSFGGKWFGGYTGRYGKKRNGYQQAYQKCAENLLSAKVASSVDVYFTCLDFRDLQVEVGDLVYCDAPYKGTGQYAYFRRPFDFASYTETLQFWAKTCSVFVSEYEALVPTWELVAEFKPRKALAGTSSAPLRMERLFRVHPEPL